MIRQKTEFLKEELRVYIALGLIVHPSGSPYLTF